MKVNIMNRFFAQAATLVRSALTQDAATQRVLENNYVAVSLSSRLWGA